MDVVSFVVGFGYFYFLTENFLLSLIGGGFSIVFYRITRPCWKKDLLLIYRLFKNIPKAIFEGFLVIFKEKEYFKVREVNRQDMIPEEVLSITLTPLSIVFLEFGNTIHIHVLGGRKK